MPTLLQISLSVTNRSVGGIAKQIGQKAIAKGWKSYITYTNQTELVKCDSTLIKVSSKLDFYSHVLLTRATGLHGLGSYFSTKKLIKQIEKINPDIIQLHNLHGYYINYKLLFDYLNNKDIPVVWTFHDCWPFTGQCAHFVTIGCEKWKTECCNCQLLKEYPKTYYDNSSFNFKLKRSLFSSNNKIHIVAVSNWLAEFVRNSFLQDKPISVIHNGIDVSNFKPSYRNKIHKDNEVVLLGVSSVWLKSKGILDFYKLRERLSSNYRIVLVGLNDIQLRNLPEGIEGFTRTKNLEELIEKYCEADIFINPTYADSFPTVNLEALACGIPVVTYQTGGSPEAVDENTGIVVPQGNIDGLIDAIDIICKDKTRYTRKLCRERAELFFDKERCFSKYIELYDKILHTIKQ